MTTPRIYLPVLLEKGDVCRTTEDQAHYLASVLRMKEGDSLIVFNGSGTEYDTIIQEFTKNGAGLSVVQRRDISITNVHITLCQAIPKANKLDAVIRHATELGVNRIIPFFSTRSVPRWDASQSLHKQQRWRKIAVEACRQSGRADIPEVADIVTFTDMLSSLPPHGLKLIPWEGETEVSIHDILRNNITISRGIILAIGPEGGFSAEEIEQAQGRGFVSVSLGKRVLRVETASLAALAVIQYESEA
jgi:16S rRNA (uracil1498-N3)-methyltransferase